MKQVEKIWAELSQWQKDILEKEGIELSEEKIELSRDLGQVLSKLQSIDKSLRDAESTMDKAYQKYKQTLKSAEAEVDSYDSVISTYMMDVKKLGIPTDRVPNLPEAQDLQVRLLQVIRGMEKLYN